MTASRINRTELLWQHFKQKAAAQPTTELRNQISVEHKKIAQKIAHSYTASCRLSYEDLEQIAMIGMLKAVEKFDPTKGVAFSSFATPYCRGEILHHLRDSGSNVKVPRRARELFSKANRVQREWVIANNGSGKKLTEEELAAQIGCTVAKLMSVRLAVAHQHACWLNDDSDEIPAPESYTLYQEQHQGLEQTWATLRQRLSMLPESERHLITQAFAQNASLKHLGLHSGLTQTECKLKLERVLSRLAQ